MSALGALNTIMPPTTDLDKLLKNRKIKAEVVGAVKNSEKTNKNMHISITEVQYIILVNSDSNI